MAGAFIPAAALPAPRVTVEAGEIALSGRVETCLDSHPFNSCVSLVLPTSAAGSSEQWSSLGGEALGLRNFPLALLLDSPLFSQHIRHGHRLSFLTARRSLVSEDVFALDGNGTLILNLTKETYQTLGLVASHRFSRQVKAKRWTVRINLREKHMVHGKPAFDRTLWALWNNLPRQGRVDAFLAVDMPNFSALVSTLTQMQRDDSSWSFHREKASFHAEAKPLIRGPDLPMQVKSLSSRLAQLASRKREPPSSKDLTPGNNRKAELLELFREDTGELLEWIGLLTASASCLTDPELGGSNPFLSMYQAPGDIEMSWMQYTWRGYITTETVGLIYNEVKSALATHAKGMPVILNIEGFANSPVSWIGSDRTLTSQSCGENDICLLLSSPDKESEREGAQYLLFEIVSHEDER